MKKFNLSHEQIMECYEKAGTYSAWDFNTALGDTFREKYESLYVKIVEMTNVLIRKGTKGYFWIITSPEIAAIFQTATLGFNPDDGWYAGYHPQGVGEDVKYCGIIDAKWRLWADQKMPENYILVGANPVEVNGDEIKELFPTDIDPRICGRISVCNFIL